VFAGPGGQAYRVALDGTSARLADVTSAATMMLIGHLLEIRVSSW
jgi:hypothetical protein